LFWKAKTVFQLSVTPAFYSAKRISMKQCPIKNWTISISIGFDQLLCIGYGLFLRNATANFSRKEQLQPDGNEHEPDFFFRVNKMDSRTNNNKSFCNCLPTI